MKDGMRNADETAGIRDLADQQVECEDASES